MDEERLCRTAAVALGVSAEHVRVHVNDSCWSAWSPVGSVHVKTDRRDVPVSYTACSNDGAIGRHVPEKDAAWAMTQGMSLAVQAMRRAAETRDRVINVINRASSLRCEIGSFCINVYDVGTGSKVAGVRIDPDTGEAQVMNGGNGRCYRRVYYTLDREGVTTRWMPGELAYSKGPCFNLGQNVAMPR